MEKRILILVRHAHRSTRQGREIDNGLSRSGRRQARALSKLLAQHIDNEEPVIISSPLKRCIETAEEIKKRTGGKLATSELVLEDGAFEHLSPMQQRIRSFCSRWRKGRDKVTVVCGHGDWIPACVEFLMGNRVWLKKAGWAQLEILNQKVELTWLVQDSGAF